MSVATRLRPFGTTVFSRMTQLAVEHQAINLSQGFPDFEGPAFIREAAAQAMAEGHNQYARSAGVTELAKAVAGHQKRHYDIDLNPMTQVGVFCGATEAMMAATLGLLEPGDEVLTFEPHYDAYPAAAAMAGARLRFVTLRHPDFALDVEALARAIGPKTRALLLNTPHNPTGKVFAREELDALAGLAKKHDLMVLSDEVYEHLWFEAPHVPIATLPGMFERTVTMSSFGKTFSFTGWKVGWASGPESLMSALCSAHQFITFCSATPLQHAAARALDELGENFYRDFRAAYAERRAHLLTTLRAVGLKAPDPQGAYFALADIRAVTEKDDVEFCAELTERVGVAAIPPSAFYSLDKKEGAHLCRFAFCKTMDTLNAARSKLWAGLPRVDP
ncbi:MAG: aminotransferase class I/II-fold pyridoxal phosphate-dependent enzyme [Myxococcota bacterium]